MPDRRHEHRRYRAPAQVIDARAAGRFLNAVRGEDGPHAGASGEEVAPPMLVASCTLYPPLSELFRDEELGISLAGLVHVEQSFRWHLPVRLGESLEPEAEIASVESRRGMTVITIELRSSLADGTPACSGRSVMMLRSGE